MTAAFSCVPGDAERTSQRAARLAAGEAWCSPAKYPDRSFNRRNILVGSQQVMTFSFSCLSTSFLGWLTYVFSFSLGGVAFWGDFFLSLSADYEGWAWLSAPVILLTLMDAWVCHCSSYSQHDQQLSWRTSLCLSWETMQSVCRTVDSLGLTACSHSSAALRARGCIFGKEFVALMEKSIASPTLLACPAHSQRSFLLSLKACEHTALTGCHVLKVRSDFLSLYWCNFSDKAYFHYLNV